MLLNPENATPTEVQAYQIRHAARGIVTDEQGNIALLHVQKHGYYKLPGGGVDEGETPAQAFARECLEEIGCKVIIQKELGTVTEYRKMYQLQQISKAYLAQLQGPKGSPNFTESEKSNQFSILWLNPSQAFQLLSTCKTTHPEAIRYILPRDTHILSKAYPNLTSPK